MNTIDTRQPGAEPYFSICVPQYNRTPHLIESILWISRQSMRDVEICISDDRSTDGLQSELLSALHACGLPFVYLLQERNQRYDGNLRSAVDLSRGRFCILLGNDDRFNSVDELQLLRAEIEAHEKVGVVITNYVEIASGHLMRRIPETANRGAGPAVAAHNFRHYSFVSGIVLHGGQARALSTSKWDGSEMYQMYLGSSIIAQGYSLLGVSRAVIAKDIQIPGEVVDSYSRKPVLNPCPIIERKHTFHLLAPLTTDAIRPYCTDPELATLGEKIIRQVLLYTYPFWILEFRRVQSWKYAAGICLGMRPRNSVTQSTLSRAGMLRIRLLYGLTTIAGLLAPIWIFDRLQPLLYRIAKRQSGPNQAAKSP